LPASLTILENSESASASQIHEAVVLMGTSHFGGKLETENHKQDQAENLKRKTGDHGVDTGI
jgi:hypothetical protein